MTNGVKYAVHPVSLYPYYQTENMDRLIPSTKQNTGTFESVPSHYVFEPKHAKSLLALATCNISFNRRIKEQGIQLAISASHAKEQCKTQQWLK